MSDINMMEASARYIRGEITVEEYDAIGEQYVREIDEAYRHFARKENPPLWLRLLNLQSGIIALLRGWRGKP